MFASKTVANAAIALVMIVPSFVALQANAYTIEELGDLQNKAIGKEMEGKTNKPDAAAIPPGQSPTATRSSGAPSMRGKLRPVAIYGIDNDLIVDILVNGAIVPLSKGDTIDGWVVSDISSFKVVMTKGKKKEEHILSSAPLERQGMGGAPDQSQNYPAPSMQGLPPQPVF